MSEAKKIAEKLTKAQIAYLAAIYVEFGFLDHGDETMKHHPETESAENAVMRSLIHDGVLYVSPERLLRITPLGLAVARELEARDE